MKGKGGDSSLSFLLSLPMLVLFYPSVKKGKRKSNLRWVGAKLTTFFASSGTGKGGKNGRSDCFCLVYSVDEVATRNGGRAKGKREKKKPFG